MPVFISPTGNSEMWDKKPTGYITVEENDAKKLAEYNKLELVASRKLTEIDNNISAAILAGFNYTIDNVDYHFSYDQYDQQNFADSANAATLAKIGAQLDYEKVTWNAYTEFGTENQKLVRLELNIDEFLDLYTKGALAHKYKWMEHGADQKAAVKVALANNVSPEEISYI